MTRKCLLTTLGRLLLAGGMSGCGLARPNWCQPGYLSSQQYRATYHDPYAEPDVAPEPVGARPRDFSKPRAEPARARAFREAAWSF